MKLTIAITFYLLITITCFAQMVNFDWAIGVNCNAKNYGKGVSIDKFGNCYVTGYSDAYSGFTIGNFTFPDDSGACFIAKVDPFGNVIWAKGFPSASGIGVATDSIGNVYCVGYFGDTLIFGNITLTSGSAFAMFLAKFDSNGNIIWAKSIGGSAFIFPKSIAVDKQRNIYVTGFFGSQLYDGLLMISGNDTLRNVFGYDVFTVKFDSVGNIAWTKGADGDMDDYGNAVSVDDIGNSYVAGYFYGDTLNLGAVTLDNTSYGEADFFLVKYSPSGSIAWVRQSSGSYDNDGAFGLDVDKNGNSYVTGAFQSDSIQFGNFVLYNSSISPVDDDLFIVKYNSSGNVIWAKQVNGAGEELGYSLSLDSSNNIYVSGYFKDSILVMGNDTIAQTSLDSTVDIFIAKLDSVGNFQWTLSAEGTNYDFPADIVAEDAGICYTTGVFRSPILYFDSIILDSIAPANFFLVKISPLTVSVSSISVPNGLEIYPNPTNSTFTITLNNQLATGKSQLVIYDVTGRVVHEQIITQKSEIVNQNFAPGIYFVRVEDGERVFTQKLIVE